MIRTICDGTDIKHDSDQSCVCDAWHTVNPYKLFAMSQNNRNGQPDDGVCNRGHTVYLDELLVISQHNRNSSTEQVVCDTRQTGT